MAAKAVIVTRLAAAGNIAGAPGKLSWLLVNNPTGGALTVNVNDSITDTTAEVFQVTVPTNDVRMLTFSVPCPFTIGIRCGTLAAGLIVTGGYIPD